MRKLCCGVESTLLDLAGISVIGLDVQTALTVRGGRSILGCSWSCVFFRQAAAVSNPLYRWHSTYPILVKLGDIDLGHERSRRTENRICFFHALALEHTNSATPRREKKASQPGSRRQCKVVVSNGPGILTPQQAAMKYPSPKTRSLENTMAPTAHACSTA